MKTNISKMVKSATAKLSKHSPEILTGLGIAGMVSTTVLAVKATPKAILLLEEEKKEKEKLTKVEVIKTCWKPYIPAMVTGGVSIACLIGASTTNAKRNAALATAYSITETAFSEYKSKVVETIGEEKEQEVRDAIAKDHITNDPVSKHEVVITNSGGTLCYDILSGRYFMSEPEKIHKAENMLNKRLMNENYISLNEFYDELGLTYTSTGEKIGWNIKNGLIDIHFSTQLTEDDRPCLVIDYSIAPTYDYYKLL